MQRFARLSRFVHTERKVEEYKLITKFLDQWGDEIDEFEAEVQENIKKGFQPLHTFTTTLIRNSTGYVPILLVQPMVKYENNK